VARGVGAYYATLICCQFFHLWTCKTRVVSIREHALLDNFVSVFGCALAVVVLLLIVYVPWLNDIFQSAPVVPQVWPCFLVFVAYIYPFTEYTKHMVRSNPASWWARTFGW
jgi:Ca2+-transporting ATPase